MRIALFCHSLLSDWGNGTAHFLRGLSSELAQAGHEVEVFEPHDAWSLRQLLKRHGPAPLTGLKKAYPSLKCERYDVRTLDLETTLAGIELILVHEWNDAAIIQKLGEYRRRHPECRVLFHVTYGSSSDPRALEAAGLQDYDGALVPGSAMQRLYLQNEWAPQAWVWYEAADTRVFYPRPGAEEGDLVWIGNWTGAERMELVKEFLIRPVSQMGISARVHGSGYPPDALELFKSDGIDYAGWLPNYQVPDLYACYKATVHIPRQSPADTVPGIPTIRLFEALACGIPLVSAPWSDADGLFIAGEDYLAAADGGEAMRHLKMLLEDRPAAEAIAARGLETVRARHTCAHRARELMQIARELGLSATRPSVESANLVDSSARAADKRVLQPARS